MDDLWRALALMLIFEGMMPFLSPAAWKQWIANAIRFDERTLRLIGLVSMVSGLIFLQILR